MLKNYFKIAWRNLLRKEAFSFISISGLGLGMGCSLLIMLWVLDERGVDAFHANGKYLYQVYERQYYNGKVEASYPTQGVLADELKRVIPEVQHSSSFEHAAAPNKLSNYFAFLAIFISCLGLFGLATFAASQRTKEIGVRKVLGASVPNIVTLLASNFLKPVTVAILIAVPVSLYLMNQWLQDFVYKINIEWWMFAAAGMIALLIAMLTVSFQAIKAAVANPVKSLRTE